jgi:3-phosphoshikimate 1-carboxyvinyltransferase
VSAIPFATEATTAGLRPAPRLYGTLRLPSDKSIAHRALIFAALADGTSVIELRQPGADVASTIEALRALGVRVEERDHGEDITLLVDGLGNHAAIGHVGRPGDGPVDCGNSGTTMRLLAGALASGSAETVLTGDASLSRRPMQRVARPLREMGSEVHTTAGHAPLVIRGRRPLRAIDHEVPIASAQVLGAICLAALSAEGRTSVRLPGATRDHSERLLRAMGASFAREADGDATITTIEGPAPLRAIALTVPGDFSSAAAWIVAATVHPAAEIHLPGVGLNPTRSALIDVLRAMGADIAVEQPTDGAGELAAEPAGDITIRSAPVLRATRIGSSEVAALVDELPLLAVAMAAAEGTSEVRGAQELRVKESDRIEAMADGLAAGGTRIEELPDGWRIRRGRPREAIVTTRGDHRVAMAMAAAAWAGLAAGVALDDPACVAVSYPSFWRDAAALGATP